MVKWIMSEQTFSHSKIISLPPATEHAASLNLQITKSDMAFLS